MGRRTRKKYVYKHYVDMERNSNDKGSKVGGGDEFSGRIVRNGQKQ